MAPMGKIAPEHLTIDADHSARLISSVTNAFRESGAGSAARAKRRRSSRAHPDLAAAIDRMPRIERKAVHADIGIITV
jgi:hypothetical protein